MQLILPTTIPTTQAILRTLLLRQSLRQVSIPNLAVANKLPACTALSSSIRHFSSSASISHPSPFPRPLLLTTISRPHPSRRSPPPPPIPVTPITPPPYRTLFIQTENTPNPDALKFLPGTRVLPSPDSPGAEPPSFTIPTFLEYLSIRDTGTSPLARRLFALPGVASIFLGQDFLTVTKTSDASWAELKPEVFSLVTEWVSSGRDIVDLSALQAELDPNSEAARAKRAREGEQEEDSEVVAMIKELLDTRIRPAVQEDGGDIEYKGFDEETGIVKLRMRGACRGCESSGVTLRNGIEGMLRHYVEEVQGVEQVLGEEEVVAMKEFEKFEKALAEKKAAAAA